MKIAAFDDVKYASLIKTPLTTYRQPCLDIGTAAVETMVSRIQNPGDGSPGRPGTGKTCGQAVHRRILIQQGKQLAAFKICCRKGIMTWFLFTYLPGI